MDALGPLASNAEISRLCGKLIAMTDMGAAYTREVLEKAILDEGYLRDAHAKFLGSWCKNDPAGCPSYRPVSFPHLTLPTIYSV